jgi:D-alanine-D-alanine ligase
VIVEEYIAGREVRCGVLEEDDGSLTLLPMTEYFLENIRTSAHKLATDEKGCPLTTSEAIVKTDGDRQCPAMVDEELRGKIEEQAFQAHRAMHARDFSLYDVRISPEGEPYFLEACNFCSFSPKSAMVSMANAAGRQHPQVFEMCLDRAAARKHSGEHQERVIGMGAR